MLWHGIYEFSWHDSCGSFAAITFESWTTRHAENSWGQKTSWNSCRSKLRKLSKPKKSQRGGILSGFLASLLHIYFLWRTHIYLLKLQLTIGMEPFGFAAFVYNIIHAWSRRTCSQQEFVQHKETLHSPLPTLYHAHIHSKAFIYAFSHYALPCHRGDRYPSVKVAQRAERLNDSSGTMVEWWSTVAGLINFQSSLQNSRSAT